jgi:hypothetical protein
MMQTRADAAIRIDAAVADWVDRDRAWLPRDRRGRWVVIEPGAGHHMSHSPRDVRRIADAATPRRARRFSSLSRARAFARSVDGTVRRWRRTPPGGGTWRRESPWQRAARAGRTAIAVSQLLQVSQDSGSEGFV